ncbi:50S ribosomal protein L1, partial [Pseudomonas sp. GW456-E7]
MAKKGKKYVEAAKLVDRSKAYDVSEAVALVKKTNTAKFDATVEVAFRLGVDPRKNDQQIRGAVVLPNGTG